MGLFRKCNMSNLAVSLLTTSAIVLALAAALPTGDKWEEPTQLAQLKWNVFNLGGSACASVSSIDISKYTGTWYQVINNRYTTLFGGGTSCTAAQYSFISSTEIGVEN